MITRKNISTAILMALGMVLLIASAALAKDITVKSSRARIRSGPGNYYKVVYTAYRGATLEVIETQDNWYKVRMRDGNTGYVSSRSLKGSSTYAGKKTYKYKPRGSGVSSVSTGQIMAATRGVSDMGMFAKQYAKKYSIDPKVLEELSVKPYTTSEYWSFINTFDDDDITARGFSTEGLKDIDYDTGAAIAMRILAGNKPTSNERLRKYVSLVGTALVAKTPLYDEEFVFIVLDDPKPQSYSTPGGYVFITTGAIAAMHCEAELAGVLAHEIAHVVERHGIKEMDRQSTRIHSEMAVDELDAEIDKLSMETGDREVAQDLRDVADRMFENIISGRKGEAEDEADKLGTRLIYSRGYEAHGLAHFVISAGDAGSSDKTGAYRNAEARAQMIADFIKSDHLSSSRGKGFKVRFSNNAR